MALTSEREREDGVSLYSSAKEFDCVHVPSSVFTSSIVRRSTQVSSQTGLRSLRMIRVE
jgi:hypothetical protein